MFSFVIFCDLEFNTSWLFCFGYRFYIVSKFLVMKPLTSISAAGVIEWNINFKLPFKAVTMFAIHLWDRKERNKFGWHWMLLQWRTFVRHAEMWTGPAKINESRQRKLILSTIHFTPIYLWHRASDRLFLSQREVIF